MCCCGRSSTGRAKVVYGSRFLGEHKAMYFWHSVGNKCLTLMTNVLFDTTLTDMETCYKVFTADVGRKLTPARAALGLRSRDHRARSCAAGNRIYEVPISYAGREFDEGKKISWRDGFVVLRTLVRCRFGKEPPVKRRLSSAPLLCVGCSICLDRRRPHA